MSIIFNCETRIMKCAFKLPINEIEISVMFDTSKLIGKYFMEIFHTEQFDGIHFNVT